MRIKQVHPVPVFWAMMFYMAMTGFGVGVAWADLSGHHGWLSFGLLLASGLCLSVGSACLKLSHVAAAPALERTETL